MKKIIKLSALTSIIIGVTACGKTGELEKVKSSSIAPAATYIA